MPAYATPFEITQATLVEWSVDATGYGTDGDEDYLFSDGWTPTFTLINSSGSVAITGTEGDEDDYDFTLSVAQTTALHPGSYRFQIVTAKGTESHLLESGYLYVRENVALEQPLCVSGKSPARQRFEHYQSLLMQESFVKTLAPGQIEELEQTMRRLEWDLKREEDAEKLKRGENTTRKLYTRFI